LEHEPQLVPANVKLNAYYLELTSSTRSSGSSKPRMGLTAGHAKLDAPIIIAAASLSVVIAIILIAIVD